MRTSTTSLSAFFLMSASSSAVIATTHHTNVVSRFPKPVGAVALPRKVIS